MENAEYTMAHRPEVSPDDARAALGTIERERVRAVGEIGVPGWYWWALAAAWVGLTVLADLGLAWVAVTVTLLFGAAHAAIAPRVIDGRHGSRQVTLRSSAVGRHVSALVIAGLVGLVVSTIGVALVLDADGADHPGIGAGVFAAVVMVLGGPLLLARVRTSAQAER